MGSKMPGKWADFRKLRYKLWNLNLWNSWNLKMRSTLDKLNDEYTLSIKYLALMQVDTFFWCQLYIPLSRKAFS